MKAKDFLFEKLKKEALFYFGVKDTKKISAIANAWHQHNPPPNNRWKEIESFGDEKGKILDMACGVGTFVFYGLEKGYDVYGVEPEEWKLEYIRMKIKENNYPEIYKERFVSAFGEKLPFQDNSFDLVVSYQTLEHVQDVSSCINEMVRVLKPGGKLHIKAPDYNSLFEGHYGTFYPIIKNKKISSFYFKLIGRPSVGIKTINMITAKSVKKEIKGMKTVIDINHLHRLRKAKKLTKKIFLIDFFPRNIIIYMLQAIEITKSFRRERNINIIGLKSDTTD